MPAPGQPGVALTIAGSDCSAGAGAQADLKTFGALGVYGLTALTCVVAETPGRVARIQPVEPDMVAEQVRILFQSFPVGAVKTGMLFSAEIVRETAEALRSHCGRSDGRIPLVVDPVMVATSGGRLLQPDAIEAYQAELFPLASVLTPNLDEAAVLLGEPVNERSAMADAAAALFDRYHVPALLKGGHLGGDEAVDVFFDGSHQTELTAPYTHGVHTHGTGCTYAAAITAGLATGRPMLDAIRQAKAFISATIAQHFRWAASGTELHALNHQPGRWRG